MRVALLTLLSLAVCVLIYLAFAVPGAWFPTATERGFGAGQLTLTRGSGHMANGQLVVTQPAEPTLITPRPFLPRWYIVTAIIALLLIAFATALLLRPRSPVVTTETVAPSDRDSHVA